jgi:acetylornithine/succinyldiaminopimelate/putrescine aminotransferase/predicted amino acid dehydrogenase
MISNSVLANRSSALNPERHFLLGHLRFNKTITTASGHYYYDAAGTGYLDFLAQYGAIPFGHNPPDLLGVLDDHRRNLEPGLVQPLSSPAAERLASKLIELAPGRMRYVTFVNSGAEAVEASIKLARARTRRQAIVSTIRGYHGKTLGALSATDNPAYRDPFLLDTTCFERVPFDDLDALERRLSAGDVAAFIVEPVQGEGGMRVPSPGYLIGAAAICRNYHTLFILDEVQTGLGRTGHLFAADDEPGLDPDMILLSKALGGGLVPLGAVLCTENSWCESFGFYHSSTFANGNFACSIGCKVVDMLLADGRAVVRNAREMGEYLEAGLDELVARYPCAFSRRMGRGLMQGIVLMPWRGEQGYFLSYASQQGHSVALLAGYLLNEHQIVTAPVFSQSATLRIEPSLTIGRAEVDRLLQALDRAGQLITAEDFAELLAFMPRANPSEPASKPAAPIRVRDVAADYRATWEAPQETEKRRGGFAFMIHPTSNEGLFDTLPKEFAKLDVSDRSSWQAWLESWFSRMYEPAPVYHLPALRSHAGGYAEGWLIAAPLTPARMMRLRRHEKAALLAGYLDAAEKLGVNITGMGAYTSIIARAGDDLPETGLNITTGNSLTAVASVESLRAVVAARGLDMAVQTVAVIGAAGSVGRVAALHASRFAGRMLLFGNPKNPHSLDNLASVAGEIYRTAAQVALLQADPGLPELMLNSIGIFELTHLLNSVPKSDHLMFRWAVEERFARAGIATPIRISNSLEEDLGRADAVISASAAGKSFIDPALFARESTICDVARPLDVLGSVQAARPDIVVYEGGVMKLPENIAFGAQNVLGYPRGYNLACLSETMVLAMEGATRSYSMGQRIDYTEALSIYDKSLKHGFEFAVPAETGWLDVRPTVSRQPAFAGEFILEAAP